MTRKARAMVAVAANLGYVLARGLADEGVLESWVALMLSIWMLVAIVRWVREG